MCRKVKQMMHWNKCFILLQHSFYCSCLHMKRWLYITNSLDCFLTFNMKSTYDFQINTWLYRITSWVWFKLSGYKPLTFYLRVLQTPHFWCAGTNPSLLIWGHYKHFTFGGSGSGPPQNLDGPPTFYVAFWWIKCDYVTDCTKLGRPVYFFL